MKSIDFNSMVKGIFPIVISGVFLLFFPLLAQGLDVPLISTQVFTGSVPPPTVQNAQMQVGGSFGNQILEASGGLDLIIELSTNTAVYEAIVFKTLSQTKVFTGSFEKGFNEELIPISLELTYVFTFSTNRPSQILRVLPKTGGGYTIEPFYTSSCGFRCYDFSITGTWTAVGPTQTISGTILSSVVNGYGIGADISSDLDPSGYPNSATLVNLRWYGNTGGVPIPRLVETAVDGVPIVLDASYGSADTSVIQSLPLVTITSINLPQTGQSKCYDSLGNEINCGGTGQDGEIRPGVEWPDSRFTMSGDCVTDNLTGLMWAKNANLPNGTKTWQGALDYVKSINNGAGLCGYNDWRLPNVNELESLVNADEANPAAWLNSQGFSNVQDYDYWSSTTGASSTDTAWVTMYKGSVGGGGKPDNYCYVWPVRSGQSGTLVPSEIWKTGQTTSYASGDDGDLEKGVSWPVFRFTDHGDGTITDNLTGLMWSKNANLPNGEKTWQGALDYVKSINNGAGLGGYNDWRLPNRKELFSLIDHSRYNPALPSGHPFPNVQGAYPNVEADPYWSSTTFANTTNNAWVVGMWSGSVNGGYKPSFGYVWPVRSGQISSLKGTVTEMSTGNFISGVTVSTINGNTQTNGNGNYYFRITPGVYDVTFSKAGYQTLTISNVAITEGKVTELNVKLQKSELLSTPNTPSGPNSGTTGISYTYSTGGSSSNFGHSIQYFFNWGDDTNSGWLPVGTTTASKSWSSVGTYSVKAQARCTTDTSVLSSWSGTLSVTISAPETVSTPSILSGPTTGITGTSYSYTTGGSTSSLGHPVQYFFDWGDSKNSGWLPVGTTSAAKSWTSTGTYSVRVQARCSTDISIVSSWSGTLSVTISTLIETISTPNIPTGPTSGTTNNSYSYSTGGSISSLGHPVEYQFDWKGDGTDLSSWGTTTRSKIWTATGTYNVRARARCATHTDVVSSWSGSLSVNITPATPGWTAVSPPTVSSNWFLSGLHFTSSSEGWAVGTDLSNLANIRGVLLHYLNDSWTAISRPDVKSTFWQLWDVYFTSSEEGWAVGSDRDNDQGLLLHYSNGAWSVVSLPPVSSNLHSLHFTSPNEGWVVGFDSKDNRGVILHYSNGSWANVSPPNVSSFWYLNSVHFPSPDEGWAVGFDFENKKGVLLHYVNSSWGTVTPPDVSSYWHINSIHVTSPGEGWAVGTDWSNLQNIKGVILHYHNGSWTATSSSDIGLGVDNLELMDVYFTSPDEGWAVGSQWSQSLGFQTQGGVLLRYLNGAWSAVSPPYVSSNWYLSAVHFISPDEGWAVGLSEEGNTKGVLLRFFNPSAETISTPTPPSGPTNGTISTSYSYSTGGSTSNLGHSIEYRFDWGDGTYSNWSSSTTALKSWSSTGTYTVKAQARCAADTFVVSNWSSGLSVTVTALTETITIPTTISGPTSGFIGTSYSYTTGGSSSSYGHSVEYQFDWKGDGSDLSPWGAATRSKIWTAVGTCNVRARARCTLDTSVMSSWSGSVQVAIASSRSTRALPLYYTPSLPLTVAIAINPGAATQAYSAEDSPPNGWAVSNISENGQWDDVNKKVKWGVFFDNNSRTLTYQVTPPVGETGVKSFSGKASFDGVNEFIGGDSTIEGALLHPADTSLNFELSVSEVTAYAAAWRSGQTWPVPPNPIPIEYPTNAGYLWRNGEVYHHDATRIAPSCWVSGAATGSLSVKRSLSLRNQTSLKSHAALSSGTTTRDLPDCYTPSMAISISITVIPGQGTQVYAVEDSPPAGWTVSDINASGGWDNVKNKVKWGPFFDQNNRTLTYKVTPPSGETGAKTFSGTASFDGTNVIIGGDLTFGGCSTGPITLQSPSDNTPFDACFLYSPPTFSWTAEETFKGYEIQFSSDSSFSSIRAKVKTTATQVTITSSTWKRVLLTPEGSEGTVYWRVVGTRANRTKFTSEFRSIIIDTAQAVGNPNISSTSKGSPPELSWENNCNTKFKVWFGSDESFNKKNGYSFNIRNPNDNGGIFTKVLTSGQWTSIRKLVKDTSGSTIYWYIESWDGLKRYNKSDVVNFVLTD
jgi:hypothetical protein